jgi:hypothetical protein
LGLLLPKRVEAARNRRLRDRNVELCVRRRLERGVACE